MRKNNRIPWLFLIPSLLIMITTVFYPIIKTFLFSLQNYKLTEPYNIKYVGLKNYIEIFKSQDFYLALKNSLIIMLYVLIISLIGSIIVALLLNKRTKITPALTAIAIIPWALPPLVNGLIWRFIFYPGYGLMNKILLGLGIIMDPISFTKNPQFFLFILAIAVSWRIIPFCSMIILSNLQSIPEDLYEAARVDGSNRWHEFKRITLPLIFPSLSMVFIKIMMASINVFDEIIAIVGLRLDSQTLLIYNYLNTFNYLDFGYGSAITYVIMILSAFVGYFYVRKMAEE